MKYLTLLFLAGLMLLVVGCGPSEKELAEAGVVSMDEIQSDFTSNSVAASQKYKEKTLTISGGIIGIGEHDSSLVDKAEDLGFLLIMGWDQGPALRGVLLCEVDLSDVLTLETNTEVIVTGIFHTDLPPYIPSPGIDYWLEGCSIVTDRYISKRPHVHSEFNRVSNR